MKLPLDSHSMDNSTHLISSLTYSWDSTLPRPVGVVGDPNLAAGVLLGFFLLGLGSYIWAFWSQRVGLLVFLNSIFSFRLGRTSDLGGVRHIHTFLKLLIVNDVMNIVTAVILAVSFIVSTCGSTDACFTSFVLWSLTRYFGVLFHVLTALACLFVLYHPQWASKFFWMFMLVFVLILVFVLCCLIISVTMPHKETIFGVGALVFGVALMVIVKYAVSAAPPSAAKHTKPIVIVSMFTVFFAFAPTFCLYCVLFISESSGDQNDSYHIAYANVLFFTNFNVFMNGHLFYFTLRVPVEEEQQQEVTLEENIPTSVAM